MQVIQYPPRDNWHKILERPTLDFREICDKVSPILETVRSQGDAAIKQFTMQFDGVTLDSILVPKEEILQAEKSVDEPLKKAIKVAYRNIFRFHESQKEPIKMVSTSAGVLCWRKSVPIEKVGLYIPSGSSPLFSTVLMLGIPANIAGCAEIVICSPPNQQGKIHPAILYTANLTGISKVFKVGGAQAIAAIAYGSETIPKVNKIFGPGNQYVTAAKQLVSQEGIAIDLPAGPSEVAIIADQSANATFVAADLLSQAEHGYDSQVLFVTTIKSLIEQVKSEVDKQIGKLPRSFMARESLRNSKLILVESLNEAFELVNTYAPEHLILMVKNPDSQAKWVKNAGSVFLGDYTPESAGDYASGTNHTLPTNGFAVAYSGVSLESFVKKITFQKISSKGLEKLGPVIGRMAEAEELEAHKQAVNIRLTYLKNLKK